MNETVCDRCHLVVSVATNATPIGDLPNMVVHIVSVIAPEIEAKLPAAFGQIGQTYAPLAIDLCPACRVIMRAALTPT